MENKENNWNEISADLNKLGKKIKEKAFEENSIEDLKDSFNNTVNDTGEMFKDLLKNIEATIKDEELKIETKEIIKKLNLELSDFFKDITDKITFLSDKKNENTEEE